MRRALYRYVVTRSSPVNRDQAAEGAGVARHVAKFHLDKLVDDGLLATAFGRPPGRGGPGAGRPAKLYRRSSRELEVSLPDRRYDFAGALLARAVTDAERDGTPVREALALAAREAGLSLGAEARARAGTRPAGKALVAAAREVLQELGYEPRLEPGGLELANCPFHALAEHFAQLVCGMNLELMTGMVAGLGNPGLDARLDPGPGLCCVRIRQRPRPASEAAGARG
ncbi:MAG: transcriptional regulator [Actinobacteria bacterium]|nr:transcriptional regulator [Actinomycetota bacterium]